MNGHELKHSENIFNPSTDKKNETENNGHENTITDNTLLSEEQLSDRKQQLAFNTWTRFMDIVRLNVSELKLNTWFKPIKPKSIEGSVLTISVPSQDYYEMIISRFGDIVITRFQIDSWR